ncbi:unnamed protein product, partial [Amoebophrya sp. A120]
AKQGPAPAAKVARRGIVWRTHAPRTGPGRLTAGARSAPGFRFPPLYSFPQLFGSSMLTVTGNVLV